MWLCGCVAVLWGARPRAPYSVAQGPAPAGNMLPVDRSAGPAQQLNTELNCGCPCGAAQRWSAGTLLVDAIVEEVEGRVLAHVGRWARDSGRPRDERVGVGVRQVRVDARAGRATQMSSKLCAVSSFLAFTGRR